MTDQNTAPQPVQPQPIDVNKRVEQYIKLRDIIKSMNDSHAEKMQPFLQAKEQLETVLKQHLHTQNVESVKTSSGTAYLSTKNSASVADMEALWNHVVTTGSFDLLDKKANVTAVKDFVEKNGVAPPGVNFNSMTTLGVRRS